MAFEGIKETLKDNWADLSSKIQENSAFNNLREKFESQSPTIQKAIMGGAVVLIVFFLFSFPWSYISSANENMSQFEENRGLIQGLLHASRAAKEPSPLPPAMDQGALRARVDMILKDQRLIPEQIGEITPLPDRPAKDLVPAVVSQTGLVVQLKKLNLDQIIALSNQFQSMSAGTKLMGIDMIQSPGQTHYYDMIVRIVNFALPQMSISDAEPEKPGKGKKPRAKRGGDEETGE
jgi:hypothetical protein